MEREILKDILINELLENKTISYFSDSEIEAIVFDMLYSIVPDIELSFKYLNGKDWEGDKLLPCEKGILPLIREIIKEHLSETLNQDHSFIKEVVKEVRAKM